MATYNFVKKTHVALVWIVLALAIAALAAELLPEVKAKMIVIPTLILVIAVSVFEIRLSKKEDLK